MKKRLDTSEVVLTGQWIAKSGSVTQDKVCERIQWLVDFVLQEIAVDRSKWRTLYLDPNEGGYWELSYPESHMHGGGPPELKRISSSEIKIKYGENINIKDSI